MIGIPRYVSSNCSKVFPTLEDFKEKLELIENKFQKKELYDFLLKKDVNSKALTITIKTIDIEGGTLCITRNKSFSKAYSLDKIETDFYEDSVFYIITHDTGNIIVLSCRNTTNNSFFEENKAILCTLNKYEKEVFYKTNSVFLSSKQSIKDSSWFCLDVYCIDKNSINKTVKNKVSVLLNLNEQKFFDRSQIKSNGILVPVHINEETFEPITSEEESIEVNNYIFLRSKDYEIIPLTCIRSGKTYKKAIAFNEIFKFYNRPSDVSEFYSLILKTKNKHIIL